MQPNSQWSDPIGQLLSLRVSLGALVDRSAKVNVRLDRATFPLVKYQASDFPESLRPRFERILQARIKVRRDYASATVFEFSRLSAKERRIIESDLVAFYEGCLLDIGKESGSSDDSGHYDIAYPREGTT
jgi:hypothetical protein